jgi:hypothetical protein
MYRCHDRLIVTGGSEGRIVFVVWIKESEKTRGSTELQGVASQSHQVAQFVALRY